MIMDAMLLFSDAQVVTGAATSNSTNVVDTSAAHNLGVGRDLHLVVKIGTVIGTTPTLTINLVGATDAAISTARVVVSTITPVIAAAQADALIHMAIGSHAAKRYYRLEYVFGGTSPGATITAGFTLDDVSSPMT